MKRGRRVTAFLILNLLAFAIFSWIAFERNPFDLYWGGEGQQYHRLILEQHAWMTHGLNLGLQPVMGAGGIFYPINTTIIPVFTIQYALFGAEDPVRTYVLVAIEMFLCILVLGRSLSFSWGASVFAAWVVPFLMLPYVAASVLGFLVGYQVPNFPEMVGIGCLMLALFRNIGRRSASSSVLYLALFGLLSTWSITALPGVAPVIVPALAGYGIAVLSLAKSRRELVWKIGGAAALLIVFVTGHFAEFVLSLYRDTASYSFPDEQPSFQRVLLFGSILFWARWYSWAGPLLIWSAVLGALTWVVRGSQTQRRLALGHLWMTLLTVVAAVYFHQVRPDFAGIKIMYVEFALWPFYALFGAVALGHAFRLLLRLDARGVRGLWHPFAPAPYRSDELSPLAVAGLAVALPLIAFVIPPGRDPGMSRFHQTPITEALQAQIQAEPDAPFRGRELTISGVWGRDSISWGDLKDIPEQDKAFGNEHRLGGLWEFRIPTLQANSQFISPPMYLVASRLLARPADRQMRNVLLTTRPNIPVLQALGVRFLIADAPVPGTRLWKTLEWDNGRHAVSLVELPDPNLGDYSPTQIVPAGDAADALATMARGIDFRRQVILFEPLDSPLVAAREANLTYAVGGFRVRATAAGRALLLLPIEYSHCLTLVPRGPGPIPRLLRANLLQTALLFTGTLDADISLAVGPFGHAACRSQDVRDTQTLDLAGAAARFPVGVPTRHAAAN
jgi:hypothetical protein